MVCVCGKLVRGESSAGVGRSGEEVLFDLFFVPGGEVDYFFLARTAEATFFGGCELAPFFMTGCGDGDR